MVSAKGWRHLGLAPPPRQAQAADLFDGGNADG
jgi:Holliday junction DNA helicase RuvB